LDRQIDGLTQARALYDWLFGQRSLVGPAYMQHRYYSKAGKTNE